jgi:hypothetical protein
VAATPRLLADRLIKTTRPVYCAANEQLEAGDHVRMRAIFIRQN